MNEMEKIGVKGPGKKLSKEYPNMPETYSGWGLKNVQFKLESNEFNSQQINIQLGKEGGKGLELFNKNLKKYEMIKENNVK